MAVPKRKTSVARKRKRRTHWKLATPAISKCSHCGHLIIPHRVCDNCGYYAGVEVLELAE